MQTVHFQADGLSRPAPDPQIRILGLGAGVQSTTLALMAARREIEPPDLAIFADTGDEPKAVYEHLAWLMSGVLPFPVEIVRMPRPLSVAFRAGDEGARFPYHVGGGGIGSRQCTRGWKIRPIRQAIRRALGADSRGRIRAGAVEQWIGISIDEVVRIKPSGVGFIHHRHPLIEARMSRQDCYRWLEDRQYRVPPKSRCKFCPYQGNADWAALQAIDAEWQETIELDGWLREPAQVARFRGLVYLHHSKVPLAEADLRIASAAPDLFGHECEGMCGV